jgi:hypothetical protein
MTMSTSSDRLAEGDTVHTGVLQAWLRDAIKGETALRDLASNDNDRETVAFHQGLIDGYLLTEREFCKGPERHIITSATEFMPCCNVVINQEPSPVRMTGWAFIPDTLHCGCGVEWRIVDGAEFGHLNPDGVTIERVA